MKALYNAARAAALIAIVWTVGALPALAQWNGPNHASPVMTGVGTGFRYVGPCVQGNPTVGGSSGASSDPICANDLSINWATLATVQDFFKVNVNSFPTSGEWGAGNYAAPQAVVGAINIPNTAVNTGTASGVAGYAMGASTALNAVGVLGQGLVNATNASAWGSNFLAFNTPTTAPGTGLDFGNVAGIEVDIGIMKKSGGATPTGNVFGVWVTGGSEVNPTGISAGVYITAHGVFASPKIPWNFAITSNPAAAQVGLGLYEVAEGSSQPSQPIWLVGKDSGGTEHIGQIQTDANGNIVFGTNLTGLVSFNNTASTITPVTNNALALGSSSFKWSNIHSYGINIYGSSSGKASIVAQAVAGTPTLTLPNASGTFAVSATSPLSLSATTGALTCSTCATTAGANIPTIAQGDLLYGSAANTLSALAKNTSATRYLSNTGTSNNPAWAQVDLSNGITKTLGVGNGGTGLTSGTSGGILAYTASGTLASSAALGANCIVYGGGSGVVPATSSSTCPTVSSAGVIAVPNTTDATSSVTGSVTLTGGMGIAKSLYVNTGIWIGGTSGNSALNIAGSSDTGFQITSSGTSTPNWLFQNVVTVGVTGRFRFYDLQNYLTSGGETFTLFQSGGASFGAGAQLDPGKGSLYVAGGYACAIPVTKTGTSGSQAVQDCSLIMNASGTYTLTLLSASTYTGRILYIKNIAAQTVNSASSNVVPVAGGAAGTAILAATAGKWAVLQSDGTNWQIMAAN